MLPSTKYSCSETAVLLTETDGLESRSSDVCDLASCNRALRAEARCGCGLSNQNRSLSLLRNFGYPYHNVSLFALMPRPEQKRRTSAVGASHA